MKPMGKEYIKNFISASYKNKEETKRFKVAVIEGKDDDGNT